MEAQILYGIGNLKYVLMESPLPKSGEALVKVSCCGICGSDVPRIYKTGAHNMPLIPGHEFSGVVETCEDAPELVGKRVGVFPLIPCKECEQCKNGHYEMCENYNYLGSRCDGGFAEYVCVPVWNLMPLPDEVSDEDAAMLEPMCVAVHAARRAGLELCGIDKMATDTTGADKEKPESETEGKQDKEAYETTADYDKSQSIVVCGLGTIGLLLAMVLKDASYKNVLFVGNKDIQKKKLLEIGFSENNYCDVRYADPVNFIMTKTEWKGADYYFECIGRSESYAQAVKCTAPLGTVMLVGNPASDMELPREVYWKILRNQLTVKGTWNSSYPDDWKYALSSLSKWSKMEKNYLPSILITHSYPLVQLYDGLEIMHRKSEEYIKIMIMME